MAETSKPNLNATQGQPEVAEVLRQVKSQMLRLRQKLSEPIAVIGIGCRFPGASSPAEYWQLLCEGREAIVPTPETRWTADLKASQPKQSGQVTGNVGGFLPDVDQFDASFFGISGREAETLDPQQRILLEVVWETLEDAGIDPHSTRNQRVGAFIGICSNDYAHLLAERDRQAIDPYLGTGNAHSVAAGRLSYAMHWEGPSTSVDTACSSSLTAVHLATRSLRYGDCDLAVAGGVNVILAPDLSISLSQAGMLSPTGHCHTFDTAADGFVRGEGCGVVLLKRLSQAEADGDRVICLIKGTAINQDGRSNGLTAPNGLAQQNVIRQALADAKVKPHEVDLIEAHGTGTQLGDPIEVSSLRGVFADARTTENPLLVGSAKTNLGHLEAAAGIAGLIKLALALEHNEIPPHLNFQSPSSQIDWNWPVQVVEERKQWKSDSNRAVAGVSSFGFGGSNAHAVLASGTPQEKSESKAIGKPQLFVISAKSVSSRSALASRFAEFLQNTNAELADICYTAAMGRSHFEHRFAVVAESKVQLQEALERFVASGELRPSSSLHMEGSGSNPLVAACDDYLNGEEVEFAKLVSGCKVSLPTYAFDRKRFWFEPRARNAIAHPEVRAASGDGLLGRRLDLALEAVVFETDLSTFSYLNDHKIDGSILFPASGFLELAISAGKEILDCLPTVEDLQIDRPIVVTPHSPCRVQTHVTPSAGDFVCQIAHLDGENWRVAAKCRICLSSSVAELSDRSTQIPSRDGHSTEIDRYDHYHALRSRRIDYGEAFQGVKKIYSGGRFGWGEVCLPPLAQSNTGADPNSVVFHPALLDACLQVTAAAIPDGSLSEELDDQVGLIPVSVERYGLLRSPSEAETLSVASSVSPSEAGVSATIVIKDQLGELVGEVSGLELKPFGGPSAMRKLEGKSQREQVEQAEASHERIAELRAMPLAERTAVVLHYLHERVAEVMGTNAEEMPVDKPLDGLGLDSLMAFELRDELERELCVMIPMEVFLQEITLNDFAALVAEKVAMPSASLQPQLPAGDKRDFDPDGDDWIEGAI